MTTAAPSTPAWHLAVGVLFMGAVAGRFLYSACYCLWRVRRDGRRPYDPGEDGDDPGASMFG